MRLANAGVGGHEEEGVSVGEHVFLCNSLSFFISKPVYTSLYVYMYVCKYIECLFCPDSCFSIFCCCFNENKIRFNSNLL